MKLTIPSLTGRIPRGPPIAALVALAAAMVVATGPPAQATSVLTNGSFESGFKPPTGTFRTLSAGTDAADDITGWLVTANSVDWIRTYWQAADGLYSLDMSGVAAGTIVTATTFNTIPGAMYVVEIYLSGNPDSGRGLNDLQVVATTGPDPADVFTQYFSYNTSTENNTKANMKWQLESWYFTAQGASTTLGFASLTCTAYGPALDNVSVELIPEPVTMAGLMLGIGCLARYVRKRR